MNFKALANVVTSKMGRQILTAQKHSPVLLFGAGVVGIVTTVVLASKATLKLEAVLEGVEKDVLTIESAQLAKYTEEDRRKDKVLIYTKAVINISRLYGPAVLVGVASIAALTGSHVVLNRRLAGVTAAYAALDKGWNEYRRRVIGEYGEDKDREFRYGTVEREIIEETKEGPVAKTIKELDPNGFSVYSKFFDELCPDFQREAEYNMLFLRAQQNYANDKLRAKGHLFLNEVYDQLGIERTKAGAVVGWIVSKDGDNFVDFGIFNANRERSRAFVNGREQAIRLDFNVDGVIYDKIGD
jgi:hypothetical protein